MSEEERIAAIIENGLNNTLNLALECAKRTDEINKRLIVAIVMLTFVFGATTCISKYLDYKSTYIPYIEQVVTDGTIKQTTK